MFEFFEYQVNNGVALVTMNRPPANAMSRQVYESLDKLIDHVESSSEVRCLVLAGADECRAWIGGADLHEFLTLNSETRRTRHDYIERVTDRFYRLSRPTVAAICKPAVGGGMVMASFCDIRVAADSTFFSMPEVDRSLTGGGGAYYNRLGLPVGFIREMILTGRRFTAAEIEKVGFLNYVVPKEQVLPKAVAVAELIAAKSLPAVQAIKESANFIDLHGWDEGRRVAHEKSARLVETADYKEGIEAFLQRRPPVYKR